MSVEETTTVELPDKIQDVQLTFQINKESCFGIILSHAILGYTYTKNMIHR